MYIYTPAVRSKNSRSCFGGVSGFRGRVWESYRTSESFVCGYETVIELEKLSGIVERAHTELTGVPAEYNPCRTGTPGIVARVVHKS